jgi:hypothetical protein
MRLGVLAAAAVMGAGVAFAYVITGGTVAWPAAAKGPTTSQNAPAPAPTTTTTPEPSPILPFNAKLTSPDVPIPGGGVRSGACSGALIAPEWIITAGHCFHDIDDRRISGPQQPYTTMVTVGKLKDSDPGGHTVRVVDVRQSPLNDLAVAKLSAPINDIVPVTLSEAPPPVGQALQFAGWGALSATVPGPSDHLKRGQFTISGIGSATFSAQPVGERTVENGPCPQDSGAPFFISTDDRTAVLVATEVSGPPCPQPGAETIARVDVVHDWITQQIAP